jgi:hypothetical protein
MITSQSDVILINLNGMEGEVIVHESESTRNYNIMSNHAPLAPLTTIGFG